MSHASLCLEINFWGQAPLTLSNQTISFLKIWNADRPRPRWVITIVLWEDLLMIAVSVKTIVHSIADRTSTRDHYVIIIITPSGHHQYWLRYESCACKVIPPHWEYLPILCNVIIKIKSTVQMSASTHPLPKPTIIQYTQRLNTAHNGHNSCLAKHENTFKLIE